MYPLKKNAIIWLATVFLLSGCTHLYKLEHTRLPSSQFNTALAKEYRAYAVAEEQQMDWYDAEYFAYKGLMAAQGKQVLPELPGEWDIPEDKQQEAARVFKQLMGLWNGPARQGYPVETAQAQMLYECWLEQLEEGWQTEDIQKCRQGFDAMVQQIEGLLAGITPSYNAPFSSVPVTRSEVVYFPSDGVAIDKKGEAVLGSVAAMLKELADYNIKLEGHTDRKGPEAYNQALSRRRAQKVFDTLVNNGVPEEKMVVKGYGETRPKLPTADGVEERLNRRVEVEVYGR